MQQAVQALGKLNILVNNAGEQHPEPSIEEISAEQLVKRAGQPEELVPSYVFLAFDVDSSYMSGQVLHPNGGTIVNG